MEYFAIQLGAGWNYYVTASDFAKLSERGDRFVTVTTYDNEGGRGSMHATGDLVINPDWVTWARKVT